MTTTRVFGQMPDGTDIHEVTIAAGRVTAKVLTLGAIIRDVRLAGVDHPLVLGFDNVAGYVEHSPYIGAVAGRCANRIARGRFTLDGKQYQLTLNEKGRTHLHGGIVGFSKRVWRLDQQDAAGVTLSLVSRDGDEGYPGKIEASVRYSIQAPGTIRMEASATTDAPTLVNLAQHSYFNLDDSPDILDHQVQIFADAYTPVDADLIPTGEIVSVAQSDYDFRAARPVRRMRGETRVAYDLNYVVSRQKSANLRPHVRMTSPKNGVSLAISSTEPGVQFYDGAYISIPVGGLEGRPFGANRGCCFEPQYFPDAVNHPGFTPPVLRPGETYRQTSTFTFARA